MDRALQRNAQPYKRSMWSMDRALQRNTHPYKRSMWSMDRSLVRNVHPYKRDGLDGPEEVSQEEYLQYLRELYGQWAESGMSEQKIKWFMEYLNELEEQLKDQANAATPEDEVSEGNHKRAKRGEPFVPAMGAPSPPLSLFSNGVDKKTRRLVPDEDSKETL